MSAKARRSEAAPRDAQPDAAADQSAIADPKDFEQALKELEGLVDQLERGDLTLEQSLAAFERGIGLSRTCQQALDAAEQRVRILTDGDETAPFPAAGTESPAPQSKADSRDHD